MIILAVDLGLKRTGLALCDENEILAYPYKLLCETNAIKLTDKIVEEYKNTKAKEILIGLPKNMDGTSGNSARKALNFGESIREKYGINVNFCDERQTTILANQFFNQVNLRGEKRKKSIDMFSATIILQSYLDFRKRCT